jgi:hypothetical protein
MSMLILYALLLLIAIIFAVFGYLLRAFYFEGARVEQLTRDMEVLSAALEEKQREVGDAREEIAKAGELVNSLEQQVRHRNEEMQRLLRPRSLHDGPAPAAGGAASPILAPAPPLEKPAAEAPHPRGWQENLNNILDNLEMLEREVKK